MGAAQLQAGKSMSLWCLKHHAYAKNVSYSSNRVMGSLLDHSRLQALSISATWTVRLTASGKWKGLLQHPTALTTLYLGNISIYGWAEAAAQLTNLKSLTISAVKSRDPIGSNLRSLTIANSGMSGKGAQGQLLQHLGRMKHLTALDLSCSLTDDWEGVPLSAFGGITASSSSLQYLDLSECSLPEGAWRSIFSQGGQQLTALTFLSLPYSTPELAANDVKRLVQACPNLLSLFVRSSSLHWDP